MTITRVSISSLIADPSNARRHGARNIEAIKGSLAKFGQRIPLVVRGGVVICGNGRLEAMRALGWTECDAVLADDLSQTEATALSIADNRTAELAEWDDDALAKTLDALLKDAEIPIASITTDFLGFSGDEFESLMRDVQIHEPAADIVEEESDEEEDALDIIMKAPFPWFGGKARIARKVWQRFGVVKCYVEPFFGSGAVMLNRPLPFEGVETVNDYDGLVANLWRAIQKDPDQVAHFADWPILEPDLHARHAWLVGQKDSLQAKLEGDPQYFDAKVAGWYCWGLSCWIGGGFCAGDGPWQVVEAEDGSRQLVHLSGAGQGVNRKLVHLSGEQGVNRQRVHLSNVGQGINRKLVHLSGERGVNRQLVHLSGERGAEDAGRAGCGEQGLLAWMRALSERLRRVRVCCGDWTRICGGNSGDALSHFFLSGEPCGIFLDPPYSELATRDPDCYRVDSLDVAHKVREWAIRHGDDPRLRIALCGYEGEHQMPAGWQKVSWKAQGGMANQGDQKSRGVENRFRERVWFSPYCAVPTKASEVESTETTA